MEIDESLILPNWDLSLLTVLAPGWNMSNGDSVAQMYMKALSIMDLNKHTHKGFG